MYFVTPANGKYLVTDTGPEGLQIFTVRKDKTCNCLQPKCSHVQAVKNYLAAGGQRATDEDKPAPPIEQCPVCGAVVVPSGTIWRCIDDGAHYWQWRGEVDGIREFLTDPDHSAKVVRAFYLPGRDEWLEALKEENVQAVYDEVVNYVKQYGGSVSIESVMDQFGLGMTTVVLIAGHDERLRIENGQVKIVEGQ